jgi:arylsulfatase A-like enzyme
MLGPHGTRAPRRGGGAGTAPVAAGGGAGTGGGGGHAHHPASSVWCNPTLRGHRPARGTALTRGAALLAAVACLLAGAGCDRPRLPHAIILVTLDTTRADHVSSYGYARRTTPALDRLAASGARFARAVSPMPTTDPAHATMLTGLYPRTHGIRQNGERMTRPDAATLATWARGAGYRTAAFTSRKHLRPSELGLAGFEHESGPQEFARPGIETLAEARLWLRLHAHEPFFVWLHLFEPHWPYEPPAGHAMPFLPSQTIALPRIGRLPPARPLSPDLIATLVNLYDGEIAYMDALVADVLAWIGERLPAGDPPLIVVVGDHGEAMGELEQRLGFAFDHGKWLYQGILQVPFVVHWEGRITPGRVVDAPAELVDLAPTLFDLLGVEGFQTQGRSLVPDISDGAGPAAASGRYAFSERRTLPETYTRQVGSTAQYAVQDGRYKLILSEPERRIELYDLTDDPEETRNLAAARVAEQQRLLDALDAWLARTPAAVPGSGIDAEKTEALRALGYIE